MQQSALACDNPRPISPFPPLISLVRYSALLASRQTRYSFAASMLGRLPIGMSGLAILLLVQTTTGSFARGGVATACYVAGLATVAPALGRLIDRYGPRLVLLVCGLIFPAALVTLVLAVTRDAPAWLALAFAIAAGASFPPITVCMRAYLKQRLGDDPLLGTAYSLESVLIETVFIIGPLLVASCVALASAAVAVLFAATCGFFGTLLFLRSPALRTWRIQPRAGAGLLGPLTEPGFVPLIGVIICYSIAFGMTEIGITAYAAENRHPALAGVLLGLMSAGSALGGLAYGSRSWGLPLARQFAIALGLMGVGLRCLLWAGSHGFLACCACSRES